ncbi:hypothetical protein PHYPSEUDO_002302 [Phytophthora pseudosyringae]|uniref:ABC-2 type transporter transmembrane domain-containing protein n=1 Tax=Phytophthora pseudosyringae TaxID=221518 RepID=A0A8T1WHS3_9STRA|nr:hypothetical protein PHYPSEUDO_002302 [Phytophthora pseudosyringae]
MLWLKCTGRCEQGAVYATRSAQGSAVGERGEERGGETVFVGELGKNAREMIAYFESIDGVAKLEDNSNPATWMLEHLLSNLDREGVSRPSPLVHPLEYSGKRAATELTQAKFLMQRFLRMYWRTASYNLTRFFLSLILGLVFGVTFDSAEYSSYAGINSGMGMLFCTTGFSASSLSAASCQWHPRIVWCSTARALLRPTMRYGISWDQQWWSQPSWGFHPTGYKWLYHITPHKYSLCLKEAALPPRTQDFRVGWLRLHEYNTCSHGP